jgi:hypothetical protein
MKMNRRKLICLLLVLALSLVLAGCNNTPTPPDEQEDNPPSGDVQNPGTQLPDLPPDDGYDPDISTELLYDLDLKLCESPYDGLFSCRGPEDRLIHGKATISAIYKGYPVMSIWRGAFAGCKNLTEVKVEAGIISIHDQAFTFATGLQKLTLPVTITSIGMEALAGCSSLTEITFQGTKDQWEAIEKGENWAPNNEGCVIRCHDGNIQLTTKPAQ